MKARSGLNWAHNPLRSHGEEWGYSEQETWKIRSVLIAKILETISLAMIFMIDIYNDVLRVL